MKTKSERDTERHPSWSVSSMCVGALVHVAG